MATDSSIETLLRLDRSSSQFPGQLSDILARREFDETVQSLGAEDLRRTVEYLDEALDCLPPAGFTFKRTHRKLRGICVSRMLLPPSHVLLDEALKTEIHPFSSGGFSDVYKGTYDGRQILFWEVVPWKRLIHPNIVPFIGVKIDPPQIASELMPHGNLTTYIKSNPQKDRVSLLVDITNGLDYLHSHGVIHGDLKGPNILVDGSGHARITDFGLAQDTLGLVFMAEGQSPRWTAPEILAETGTPSTEADVFSFGMVMVEAFTGMAPFGDHIPQAAIAAIISGKRPPRPTHSGLTHEVWELMNRCWDQRQHHRPRMLEVLLVLDPLTQERTHPSGPPPVTPDVPCNLVSDIQRRLENLEPSKKEFRPLLYALLSHKDLRSHIDSLRKDDIKGFVELLDEALSHVPVTDDLFRKALRRLQSTCSYHEVLPQSCFILGRTLSNRGVPSAAGGSAGLHEGRFDGKKVWIRALRPNVQCKTSYGGAVVWKRLQHPNIVSLIGIPAEISPFEMVCDWMDHGSITEYVGQHPEVDRIGLLWDVAEGLHHLHLYNVVHGNLKGANVLIDKDGHARLTDFGLASVVPGNQSDVSLPEGGRLTTAPTWAAPEISKGGTVTKGGDVFAFGMVAIETFTGGSPPRKFYDSISTGEHPERPATLREDLWDFMQTCWSQDPGKRPTSFDLVDYFRPSFLKEQGTSETQTLSSTLSGGTWAQAEVPQSPECSSSTTVNPTAHDPRLEVMPRSKRSETDAQRQDPRLKIMRRPKKSEIDSHTTDPRLKIMRRPKKSEVDSHTTDSRLKIMRKTKKSEMNLQTQDPRLEIMCKSKKSETNSQKQDPRLKMMRKLKKFEGVGEYP
ncbi:kinase-like domain-containing protein [Thelephora terrestris]|uniref:Kinase-like domain-containing protein n=1 Tax=Thelephora terrestris TaxID=56493 RepID=A0A9P6HMF0_9AGAM|nr:kinase-like domain-containing protein [Thelephora terrestris]